MDSFELNKIIAAIIITVLLVFGIDKFTDYLFYTEKPQQSAYKVTIVKKENGQSLGADKKSSDIDIKSLLAMGDEEHGKNIFKKCSACHSITKGGSNRIGPALWGVLGRQSASLSDYKYSNALIAHGKIWSFEEMNGFLIKPSDWIKGTKMAFAGLKKERDRASVILYLNQNSDDPKPLP